MIRYAIKIYEIKNERQIKRIKNDKSGFQVKCMNDSYFPWRLKKLKIKGINTFIVKSVI